MSSKNRMKYNRQLSSSPRHKISQWLADRHFLLGRMKARFRAILEGLQRLLLALPGPAVDEVSIVPLTKIHYRRIIVVGISVSCYFRRQRGTIRSHPVDANFIGSSHDKEVLRTQ